MRYASVLLLLGAVSVSRAADLKNGEEKGSGLVFDTLCLGRRSQT
jgi:hypothetical protein